MLMSDLDGFAPKSDEDLIENAKKSNGSSSPVFSFLKLEWKNDTITLEGSISVGISNSG
jgi:hypothetical protein